MATIHKKTSKKISRKRTTADSLLIKNERQFDAAVERIEFLMNKGSLHLSGDELTEIRSLSLAAQEYESNKYTIDPPQSLEGIIEGIMYQRRLKQKELAKELGVSDAKLSLIMNGRQKPDVRMLKSLHDKYGINAETLLKAV
jgi:HTH-type transcriptional regulator / antitoxin HigA